MIEAITELFVERVPRAIVRPVLATASRLLVVDACGGARRIAELTALVERLAPVTATYASFDGIGSLPESAEFEIVWLFVDEKSDLSYCGLYTHELAERFSGARIELVGIGEVDLANCVTTLTGAMAGSAPPWRRGRELARGAAELWAALAGPRVAP